MFQYLGNIRAQWFFATPNMLAAFLAIWTLVLAGITLNVRRKWLFYLGMALWTAGAGTLAATYSRGGGVAYLAGMAGLWYLTRRRAVLVQAAAFGLIMIVMPAGIERIASTAQTGDGSILHRLWLYRGAVGSIAEFPWSGCPVTTGKWYQLQYMPAALNEHYNSFLNDSLSLAGDCGIWAFFLFWLAAALGLWWGARLWRVRPAPWAAGWLGALVALLTAGMFSTFYPIDGLAFSYGAVAAVLAGWIGWNLVRKHWRPRRFDLILPFAAALCASFTVAVAGGWVAATRPYRVSCGTDGRSVSFAPAQKTPRARVVYLFPSEQTPIWDNMNFPDVRRWAQNGFDIRVRGIDSGQDGLRDAEHAVAEAAAGGGPVVVLGTGLAASNALIAAAKTIVPQPPRCVIVLNATAEWPFPELSAIRFAARLTAPLILLHQQGYREEAESLAAVRGKDAETRLIRYPDGGDDGTLAVVLEWFNNKDAQ